MKAYRQRIQEYRDFVQQTCIREEAGACTIKLQVKLHRKNKNVIICLWNEVLLCVTIQEDFCFIENSCRTKG